MRSSVNQQVGQMGGHQSDKRVWIRLGHDATGHWAAALQQIYNKMAKRKEPRCCNGPDLNLIENGRRRELCRTTPRKPLWTTATLRSLPNIPPKIEVVAYYEKLINDFKIKAKFLRTDVRIPGVLPWSSVKGIHKYIAATGQRLYICLSWDAKICKHITFIAVCVHGAVPQEFISWLVNKDFSAWKVLQLCSVTQRIVLHGRAAENTMRSWGMGVCWNSSGWGMTASQEISESSLLINSPISLGRYLMLVQSWEPIKTLRTVAWKRISSSSKVSRLQTANSYGNVKQAKCRYNAYCY